MARVFAIERSWPCRDKTRSLRSFFFDLELIEYPKASRMLDTKFFRLGIDKGYQRTVLGDGRPTSYCFLRTSRHILKIQETPARTHYGSATLGSVFDSQ